MQKLNFTILDNAEFHQRFDSSARLHHETLSQMKGITPHLIDPSIAIVRDSDLPSEGDTVYFPFFIREPFTMETMDFCSLIDEKHRKLLIEEKIRPILFMISEAWPIFERGQWRSTYSKVIGQFTSHGIKEENIVWLVCVKDKVPEWVKAKFIHFDYFLEQQKSMKTDFMPLEQIDDVFISMARGVHRHHRYGMTYSLYKNDLMQHGKLSCSAYENFKYMNNTRTTTTDQYVSALDCFDNDSFQKFKDALPMDIDFTENLHQTDQNEAHLLKNVFVNLVNETHQPDNLTFVTEKTYRSINYCRPFIVNGDNGTLAYLKDLGFKTFSDFWDESYDDNGTSDQVKIRKITDIIKDLCSRSKDDLIHMFQDMTPIIKHNHEHLQQFEQWHKLNIQ